MEVKELPRQKQLAPALHCAQEHLLLKRIHVSVGVRVVTLLVSDR